MNLRELWRRGRRDREVELERLLDRETAHNRLLGKFLADARAKQLAAEEAVARYAQTWRAIADVLADQSITTAAANQRIRELLMGGGPDA